MPHRRSHTLRSAAAACALVAAIAAAGIWGSGAEWAEAGESTATSLSVDTDISGNSAAVIGANDPIVALNPCDAFAVDVTITDIPATNPMVGFGFTINYDAANVEIQASNPGYLLTADPQSSLFDPGPSFGPNDATVSAFDIAVDAEESGSGVLARLAGTIPAGTDVGNYPLTLSAAAHIDNQNQARAPDVLSGATFSIDGSCNGDADCNLTINSVDALKLLRHSAGLAVTQTEPCSDIGTDIGPRDQGDVDCGGVVNSVDALKVLRAVAGLSVAQIQPCPPIVP